MTAHRKLRWRWGLAAAGLCFALTLSGQIAVRPDDPSGLSIREARVRVIHHPDSSLAGSSLHLMRTDPWLAYQRGRSYFFREWSLAEGVFDRLSANSAAAATNSCGMCHNLPFRSPGAGGNAAEPAGHGRNTPHLFGAGIIEMIGQQMRHQILQAHDANGNGVLEVPAETAGKRAFIRSSAGVLLDYGSLEDLDGDGYPDLNRVLKPRFVDAEGRWLVRREDGRPSNLEDPRAVGYDLHPGVFASSAGDHQFPTLRVFSNGVLRTVMGIPSDDPTVFQEVGPPTDTSGRDGVWARRSHAGARQPNLNLTRASRQAQAEPVEDLAASLGEGEIDLLEWFLLNHPAPALGRQDAETRRGRELLTTLGCTSCHVADWSLPAAQPQTGWAGDRRFFDLVVTYSPRTDRLEGRLVSLAEAVENASGDTEWRPAGEAFLARDVFSDFRHHRMGERFAETYVRRGRRRTVDRFRTPPLWGVGSTAPYGHDGRSMTLEDVIERHGGDAADSAQAWRDASVAERRALIAFLRSLVLYQPDLLPTDLDGDGEIAAEHRLDGRPVGPERFQPELLFRVAPRYQGWIEEPSGERRFSYRLLNQSAAYGEDLAGLVDRDGDMLPDILQPPESLPRAQLSEETP